MILTIHRQVVARIGRFSVSYDHQRTWHLHIRGVQQEDAGRYMCQVNSEPMISQVGHVHVVVPPSVIDEDSSPSQLSVRENVRVSLLCRGRGVPAPRVNWKREDGRPLIEGKTGNHQMENSSGVTKRGDLPSRLVVAQDGEELIFSKISRTDSGAYLCIASNGVPPSVSKRITLDVEFEPMMFVPHQLLGSPLGGTLILECLTEAHPRPITFWTRTDTNNVNGIMLLPSKRLRLDTLHVGYQTQMRLHIHQVEAQDIGHYKCVSKNSLGEAEGSIRVYEMLSTPPPPKQVDARLTSTATSTFSPAAAIPSAVNDADRRPGENDDNSGEFTETGTNRKGKATHESVLGDQTVPYKNTAKKFNSVANSRSQGSPSTSARWSMSSSMLIITWSIHSILFR
ncbi:lachesin-like isoform X2 [Daphnia pulicaria]|nr:lachesin-like isoform X2 [Daphnia pulicaria]